MVSRGEEELYSILKKQFPHHIIKRQAPIKIKKKTLYVDFLIPELKIALEFDGKQHYQMSTLYHNSFLDFQHNKLNDVQKELKLLEDGYVLIRFKYDEPVTLNSLKKKLKEARNGKN